MNRTPHRHPDDEPAPEVPRSQRGGLPLWIVLVCIALFAVGFWLFRQWRGQYVDYSGTFGLFEFSAVLGL